MPTDYPSDQAAAKQITPEVTWAQRSSATEEDKNFIYLTISVPDVPTKDMKLDLQPTGLKFTGHSDTKKATYHVEMDFFSEIDPAKSKVNHSARDVEMKLQKKELKEEYWPRLLKEKTKAHYLKTDFDKWVDEDEQDGVPDDEYMNQFGGMGGAGGDGGFGGLDFSKLGGGAGGMPDLSAMGDLANMGGMGGMPGMGGDADGEDDDDDDDDEDMPGLEDSDAAGSGTTGASATKTSAKIEEVE